MSRMGHIITLPTEDYLRDLIRGRRFVVQYMCRLSDDIYTLHGRSSAQPVSVLFFTITLFLLAQRCFYHLYKHMSDLHEGHLCSSEGAFFIHLFLYAVLTLCSPSAGPDAICGT